MVGDFSSIRMKGMNLFTFIARKGIENVNIGFYEKILILREAYSYNLNVKDKREVKKIIFEYFELIEQEWDKFQKEVRK